MSYADRGERGAPGTRPQPRVMAQKCATCIFRSGNPMHLASGRVGEIVERNLRAGAALICHVTTYGQRPDLGETVCRGFYDAYRHECGSISAMERLFGPDVFEEVTP